jgi:hypothetical protein
MGSALPNPTTARHLTGTVPPPDRYKRVNIAFGILITPVALFCLGSLVENQTLGNEPFYAAIPIVLFICAVVALVPAWRRGWMDFVRAQVLNPSYAGAHTVTFVAWFGSFGMALILWAVLVAVAVDSNAWWDDSPRQGHVAEVVKLNITSNKSGPHYHATVRSWRPGHETEYFEIPSDLYRTLTPHSRLRINIAQGRWRWPYVRDVQAASK